MSFIVYNARCTLYIVHYTLCLKPAIEDDTTYVRCTTYTVQCTVYGVQRTLYGTQCMPYNVQCTAYDVRRTTYGILNAVYSDVQRVASSDTCIILIFNNKFEFNPRD